MEGWAAGVAMRRAALVLAVGCGEDLSDHPGPIDSDVADSDDTDVVATDTDLADTDVVDTEVLADTEPPPIPCVDPPPHPFAGLAPELVRGVGRPLGTADGGMVIPLAPQAEEVDVVTLRSWRPGEATWTSTEVRLRTSVAFPKPSLVERAGVLDVWLLHGWEGGGRLSRVTVGSKKPVDLETLPVPFFGSVDSAAVSVASDGAEIVALRLCEGWCAHDGSVRTYRRPVGVDTWTTAGAAVEDGQDVVAVAATPDGRVQAVSFGVSYDSHHVAEWASTWHVDGDTWVGDRVWLDGFGTHDAAATTWDGVPGALVAWQTGRDLDGVVAAAFADAETGSFGEPVTLLREAFGPWLSLSVAVDATGHGAILLVGAANRYSPGGLWVAPVENGVPSPAVPVPTGGFVNGASGLGFTQACGAAWALLATTAEPGGPAIPEDWDLLKLAGP